MTPEAPCGAPTSFKELAFVITLNLFCEEGAMTPSIQTASDANLVLRCGAFGPQQRAVLLQHALIHPTTKILA